MKLNEFTKKEIKLYDRLLYVKADTKRLKLIEYDKGKRKILLNKEREVRKTNAGGMAKKKYRRHYGSLIKNTKNWHQSEFSKVNLKANYEKIKFDILKEEQLEYFKEWLNKKNLNREWYEKFRWFKVNENLVIGGKSKETNEELLKRYLQENDIVLHTEAAGSPFFIIKDENVLKEAAVATAYYSQDWRDHKRDVKVMYCYGRQIKKKQGMPIGTFCVEGERKIIIVKKEEIERFEV